MFQLLTRDPCFSIYPHDGGVLTGRALKRWCRKKQGMWPCTVYLTKLGCSSIIFFKSSTGIFPSFHSGSSDSMYAFLLRYWLCCKQSSEQNWFMIHFAAIQTASSEVTKKFCLCTHLINETQSQTRQNRTPTRSSGVPTIKHASQNPQQWHAAVLVII